MKYFILLLIVLFTSYGYLFSQISVELPILQKYDFGFKTPIYEKDGLLFLKGYWNRTGGLIVFDNSKNKVQRNIERVFKWFAAEDKILLLCFGKTNEDQYEYYQYTPSTDQLIPIEKSAFDYIKQENIYYAFYYDKGRYIYIKVEGLEQGAARQTPRLFNFSGRDTIDIYKYSDSGSGGFADISVDGNYLLDWGDRRMVVVRLTNPVGILPVTTYINDASTYVGGFVYGNLWYCRAFPRNDNRTITVYDIEGKKIEDIQINVAGITEINGMWVDYKCEKALIYMSGLPYGCCLVDFTPVKRILEQKGYILNKQSGTIKSSVSLRRFPQPDSDVLKNLATGTPLQIFEKKQEAGKSWYYVETIDHAIGWILAEHIDIR